ncbi:unnamed protein product [Rhodiola kirilowii]
MGTNTRLAIMAELETGTAALETGLDSLTQRVDHNHNETKQSIDELRKELRESFDRLAAMMNPPVDRRKGPMVKETPHWKTQRWGLNFRNYRSMSARPSPMKHSGHTTIRATE